MTRIKSLLVVAALAVAQLHGQSDSSADRGKAAQAQSQEEFDRYLEVVTAPSPAQVIAKAEGFATGFPQSELLAPAYQLEMHAFEQLNDFPGMLAAGRKALAANPDNVSILLTLAPAMASRAAGRSDKAELLWQAEDYARKALTQIDATRLSKKTSMEQWSLQKRQMQAEAHGVLGTVALQRKQANVAVEEFQTALNLTPKPQGIDYLRLGLALNASGAKSDAQKNFRRAAELGPELVSTLAQEETRNLK
jgi:tetratricopeptide (TPR) repeat protein